jgi:hypothetical protein
MFFVNHVLKFKCLTKRMSCAKADCSHLNPDAKSLIVPNAPIITGPFFVFMFNILLTSISRSLYLLIFSVPFMLTFESTGMAISISRQVFCFFSCCTVSDRFASSVRSVVTGTSYIIVVLWIFISISGVCS